MTHKIIPETASGGGATDLPDLTDVDDATVATTAGHVLRATGTAWVNSAIQDADLPSTIARDLEVTAAIAAAAAVGVRAYRTAVQSITSATFTAVQFTSESFDTDGFHDNVTNNTRFTVPAGKAGKYLLICQVKFSANATGIRYIDAHKNGVTFLSEDRRTTVSGGQTTARLVDTQTLAVADYVQFRVYQDSGGALDITGQENETFGALIYLGS